MPSILDLCYGAALAAWFLLSLLRFARMYEPGSRFQTWRRWDLFHLIPVGAFFGPNPPPTEIKLFIREFSPEKHPTRWRQVFASPKRSWVHCLWSPHKHLYRAKLDAARNLMAAAAQLAPAARVLPSSLMVTDPYLGILRAISALPRVTDPTFLQFAAVETSLPDGRILRCVISSLHRL